MQKKHEKYILRCLQLAQNGLYDALPNPSVGAVLVYKDRIIGEGATSPYGGAHAEVNAIESVTDKSLLTQATLYVSLEPCSHYGKTPPCTDLIIKSKIPEVVIGTTDPFEKVRGNGIRKLTENGINVTTGVLEEKCRELNKRFFTFHQKKRPYIILKWAESADHFIAPLTKQSKNPVWISNPYSRQLVHQWRSQETAFLVGTKTVLDDDPSLTTRDWYGKNPMRIYIDRNGSVDTKYKLQDGSTPTLCFTENGHLSDQENLSFIPIDFSKSVAHQICDTLYQKNMASVVVEGGAKTIQQFIDAELWDEARIFRSKNVLRAGIPSPKIRRRPSVNSYTIASDTLEIIYS